jgi:hypothetical protein
MTRRCKPTVYVAMLALSASTSLLGGCRDATAMKNDLDATSDASTRVPDAFAVDGGESIDAVTSRDGWSMVDVGSPDAPVVDAGTPPAPIDVGPPPGCGTELDASVAPETPDATAGYACNDVVLGVATLTATTIPASLPAALGGTIADGTYDLTGWTTYTGPGGATGPTSCVPAWATVVITAGRGQFVDHCCGAQQRYNADLRSVGTTLVVTQTCPTMFSGGGYPYTATATQLITFNGSTFTETWTRR